MKHRTSCLTGLSARFLALFAASLLIGACGSPTVSTANTGAATSAPATNDGLATSVPTSDNSAATSVPVTNSAATTITFWSWNGGPNVAGAATGAPPQLVVEFNKTHPDIQVEWKFYQYVDYLNALKLAIASGEGPDLYGLQAGALVKEYNEFTEDLGPYAVKDLGANWQDQFYDLSFSGVKQGDKLPGMPLFNSAAGYLWYNKTLFDKAGLQPPTTMEEWVNVCTTLNGQGQTCFVQGAKDAWINFDTYIALANDIAPGKIYDAEAGKIAWTDPDLVKAMDMWGQMFQNGIMQKGALGIAQYPDANELMGKGQAGMILFGMWNNYVMTKATQAADQKQFGLSEPYEYLPVLFPDVNGDGKPGQLFGGPDVVLAMNINSKQKAAAWEFVKWAVSKEGGQKIMADNVAIPSLKGLTLNDSDVATDAQKANLKQQLIDLENAVGKREFDYPELKTALGDALQNVASGTQTSQQALEAVEQVSKTLQR